MGVKSTVTLSRAEAERRLAELRFDRKSADLRRKTASRVALLTDTELELKLEQENDRAHGGEGYENYPVAWGRD